MRPLLAIVGRDLARGFEGGGAMLPLIFFLLVATLFPFAVGPDGVLLAKVGGGALWMAALLAALLPIDRLVLPDAEAGILDQYAVRGLSDEAVAAAKIIAHWLSFGPPLMLAAFPAAALLRLDGSTLGRLEAGLAIGLTGMQIRSSIIAPLMLRNVLPSLSSTIISLFKDTSLAAAIAVPELTFAARKINVESFRVIETWMVTSALYVAACFLIAAVMRFVERRLALPR